jgi:hypothetical protein
MWLLEGLRYTRRTQANAVYQDESISPSPTNTEALRHGERLDTCKCRDLWAVRKSRPPNSASGARHQKINAWIPRADWPYRYNEPVHANLTPMRTDSSKAAQLTLLRPQQLDSLKAFALRLRDVSNSEKQR